MVKRSRHRPFTAVTRVRFPVGSPDLNLFFLIERQVFYYVGNIVFDISVISTKVSYENMWRSHFCYYVEIPVKASVSTGFGVYAWSRIIREKPAWQACNDGVKKWIYARKWAEMHSQTWKHAMIVKQHGGVLPWAAMPLTAGNDRKKAAALISQNRHQWI